MIVTITQTDIFKEPYGLQPTVIVYTRKQNATATAGDRVVAYATTSSRFKVTVPFNVEAHFDAAVKYLRKYVINKRSPTWRLVAIGEDPSGNGQAFVFIEEV